MFVSTAAVAAAPAVAMNSAADEPLAIDHKGILARVEQIVDLAHAIRLRRMENA